MGRQVHRTSSLFFFSLLFRNSHSFVAWFNDWRTSLGKLGPCSYAAYHLLPGEQPGMYVLGSDCATEDLVGWNKDYL